jgi:hypothetical protein
MNSRNWRIGTHEYDDWRDLLFAQARDGNPVAIFFDDGTVLANSIEDAIEMSEGDGIPSQPGGARPIAVQFFELDAMTDEERIAGGIIAHILGESVRGDCWLRFT